ncbi:MAG: hypothetical protein U0Q16_39800 [Bryobacteraceae bacterium]
MGRGTVFAFVAMVGIAYGDVSGTPALTANTGVNLDTGAITAPRTGVAADLLWTGTSLDPQGRATAAVIPQLTGETAYNSLPAETLTSFRAIASGAAIAAARLPVNQVVVVFTNGGHTAKMLVTANGGGRLELRFTTFIAATPAGPVISRLLNNSSRVSPGLPHYGIAPSSIFVVTGANLADPADLVLQSSASPGLPLTLNGASLSVTVGGVTTRPPIYYTSPAQIAAVLPANTPAGTGTLSLTHNGSTANTAITVVSNALGFNTYNGSAVATDAITGALISYSNSASPGQILVFWTTGLGADPSDSDTTYTSTPHSVGVPLRLFIGGVEAAISYQGSAGYPGVNQINATIPASVPNGCFVSVVAVIGGVANHSTTLPIQSGGGACVDAVDGLTGDQVAPRPGQTLRAGLVSLVQATRADSRTGALTTSTNANAAFEKYSGLYPNTNNLVSPGSCIVFDFTPVIPPTISGLDVGTVTVSGPAGLNMTLSSAFGIKGAYTAALPAIPSTGGTYTFRGTGGADVGSFSSTLTLTDPLFRWANPEVASSIVKTQGVTVTWTGGSPGTYVNISGAAVLQGRTAADTVTGGFSCLSAVEAKQFTVPAYILSALPDANGSLEVQNLFFLPLSASGLDTGVATGTIARSANAVYRSSGGGLAR